MDQVLVRVKRLRKNPYKKLLSDTKLYPTLDPTAVSMVDYNPDHNLDEDAWFKIDKFSEQEFYIGELNGDLDTKDYENLSKGKFQDISCLIGIQGKDIYFQKVTPSSFITRKIIQFGDAAHLEESANRIIVKPVPDAVFIKGSDVLLFRDIAAVSSIFPGIDQLYKEATEAEVKAFLNSEFIRLVKPYDHSSVSKPNRKRLALVTDTLQAMPAAQRENLVEYIKDYCKEAVTLTTDGKCFELSTDQQLKLVLYGIEERFYTTMHSQEKRLANSVQAIG